MYLLSNTGRFIISERTFCIHNIEFSCPAALARHRTHCEATFTVTGGL
jgi:hypothetical protein